MQVALMTIFIKELTFFQGKQWLKMAKIASVKPSMGFSGTIRPVITGFSTPEGKHGSLYASSWNRYTHNGIAYRCAVGCLSRRLDAPPDIPPRRMRK